MVSIKMTIPVTVLLDQVYKIQVFQLNKPRHIEDSEDQEGRDESGQK